MPNQSENSPEELVRAAKKRRAMLPEIMMACGTSDFLLDENRKFAEFLREQEVGFVYIEGEGNHNFEFWNAHLEKSVKWLLDCEINKNEENSKISKIDKYIHNIREEEGQQKAYN